MLLAGGDDIIIRLILLQDQPLGPHKVFSMTPIPQGIQIAKVETSLKAKGNPGRRPGDFTTDKRFPPAGRLMVEQNPVAGEHVIGLAVVDGAPVGIQLGAGIGGTGIKRRCFALGRFLDLSVEFGSGGLIKPGLFPKPQESNRF